MGRKPSSTAPVRAEILSLAKGGAGVARLLGDRRQILFVQGTAPGDLVEVVPEGGTKASLFKILEPSPVRTDPPCPYAHACGGCDWMHLAIDTQRSARRAIVLEALQRAGFEIPSAQTHDTTQLLGYRGRVRLAVRACNGQVAVGFRGARSHRVIPVSSCLVLLPVLNAALRDVGLWLEGSSGSGELSLAAGQGGLPALHLVWSGELSARVFAQAEERVMGGLWAGVSIWLEGANRPAIMGDPRGLTMGVDDLPLHIPPGGFMQAHQEMNRVLVRSLDEAVRADGTSTLELFAGSGNFTVALARWTDRLDTVEQSFAAVDASGINLQLRALRARSRVGDADAVSIRGDVRLVVLDPPRAGARGASTHVAASKARKVAMVSCDPATLARDASILRREGHFLLERVSVFEMFPYTSHVEILALFRRDR